MSTSALTTEAERCRICDKIAACVERGRTAPRDQWLDLERLLDHWPSCRVVSGRIEGTYYAGRTNGSLP
jgi:hypothetical protein